MPDRAAPALLCVGNITIDEAVQPDGSRSTAFGGDALFAALAARLVTDDVAWLAPLGNDVPAELAAQLQRAGLSLAGQPRRELPTVRNVITYRSDGSRTWAMACSGADFDVLSVRPADVPPAFLEARGVLVAAMGLGPQCDLVEWLDANSAATLYLDLQEDYIAGHETELLALIGHCDVFLPSETEVRALSGSDDLAGAMRRFRALGPRCVVVKRAERGCLVLAEGSEEIVEVAAEVIDPVDSTGAGDAFCGAFAARHVLTGNAVEAAHAGAAAARLAVSAPGWAGIATAVAQA